MRRLSFVYLEMWVGRIFHNYTTSEQVVFIAHKQHIHIYTFILFSAFYLNLYFWRQSWSAHTAAAVFTDRVRYMFYVLALYGHY